MYQPIPTSMSLIPVSRVRTHKRYYKTKPKKRIEPSVLFTPPPHQRIPEIEMLISKLAGVPVKMKKMSFPAAQSGKPIKITFVEKRAP